jgi:hypothetical protein
VREAEADVVHRSEIALLAVIALGLAVQRVVSAATSTPVRMFDSAEYLDAHGPNTKPLLGALIMRTFTSDSARAIGLAVIGTVATIGLLVALLTSVQSRPGRWIGITGVAIWMASAFGRLWDGVVLPESLGISVGIAAVAAVSAGLLRGSRSLLVAGGVLAVALPSIRETLAVQAVVIVGLVAWGLLRSAIAPTSRRVAAAIGVGALVAGMAFSLHSIAGLGDSRYDVGYVDTTAAGFRTANVIWRRFALVDRGWLAHDSIFVPAGYEPPLVVPTYFDDHANVVSAERGGTSLVLRFLVAHPGYAIRAPFTDEQGISFDRSLLDTYDPKHHFGNGWLDDLLEAPGRALGIALALVTLGLVAWRPWKSSRERTGLALLAGASMVSAMLAWHLDGVEALRHVVPSLSLWLATLPFAIAALARATRSAGAEAQGPTPDSGEPVLHAEPPIR